MRVNLVLAMLTMKMKSNWSQCDELLPALWELLCINIAYLYSCWCNTLTVEYVVYNFVRLLLRYLKDTNEVYNSRSSRNPLCSHANVLTLHSRILMSYRSIACGYAPGVEESGIFHDGNLVYQGAGLDRGKVLSSGDISDFTDGCKGYRWRIIVWLTLGLEEL